MDLLAGLSYGFVKNSWGVPADFSASLTRFFAKNSAYRRKNAAECGKDSCFLLLYGRKHS